MATSILSIGPSADTVTGNRLNISDGSNYFFSAVNRTIGQKTIPGGIDWGVYESDAVRRGNQPLAPYREISFGLGFGGAPSTVTANLHALQKVLKQARDAAKLGALGLPVVLVWVPDLASVETYIDVIAGSVELYDRQGKRSAAPLSEVQAAIVRLTVRPAFRQAPVTIATSSTVTDCATTYRVADVGSESDAPTTITITDQSIGSKIINRIRGGRRSLSPLAAADFTPILAPTFKSPGSNFTDATARGGATPRLAATTPAWQTLATVAQPGTGLAQGGEVAVWGRVRDSSPYIDPTDTATAPTVTPSTASGTMPPDSYFVRLATVDSNGVESAAGYPQTVTLPQAAAGLYDTFSSGGLANWDNSGYAQFYRGGTTQTAGAGSITAIPDAAYEGVYGARALVTSTVAAAVSTPDIYRCVLQKAAQGIAAGASGTTTVYGRFRVNEIITPDGIIQPFITFFSTAQGNTSGGVAGYTIDYANSNSTANSSGVIAGLRFIGGDEWQFCAPYGPGGAWAPVPSYYVHISNGNWYNFACAMTVTFVSGTTYKLTCLGFTLNGVQVVPALAQTAASSSFPATGAVLTPTIGAELFGPPTAAAPFYDLNDILSVDFDDVGCETVATLGNLAVSWPAVTNAASYNVYYAPVENATVWGRVVLGNVTSTTISAPVTTAATLPQSRLSGVTAPALVRVLALPPNAAAVGGIPSQGGQPLYGRSLWEWVLLGVITLPTVPAQDGIGPPAPWLLQLQAEQGGANSSTVDIDTIVLMSADEDMLTVEIPGAVLPSLSTWVLNCNRLDRQSCTVTPVAGGSATAYASVTGRMHVGQGDNTFVFMFDVSDSSGRYIADIINTKTTIGIVTQPVVWGV